MSNLTTYRAWKSRNATGVSKLERYRAFLRRKAVLAPTSGFAVSEDEMTPGQKPHQWALTQWACAGGNRAIFALFGLGKTRIQLDIMRLCLLKTAATHALIVAPLGVAPEFFKDAAAMDIDLIFIRSDAEIAEPGIYLTNFESVRDGKLNPARFGAASLDEASVLRGFGGSKTFREFMRLFEPVPHRYVATAVPDPNDHIELLAYAAFLGVMDVGQAKTRFFKRNPEKADELTLHVHKEREFWLWVSSWAIFLQKPSQLGFSDEGYELPEMDVRWHEVPVDHAESPLEGNGQHTMFRGAVKGVVEASREKRETIPTRIAKVAEILAADPDDHFLIWHDLEAERRAIEQTLPGVVTVYGQQDTDEREAFIADFAEGRTQLLATKPVMYGSGRNFQYFCHREIFAGIGFKFSEFIQGIYRVNRFGQKHKVRIDIVYAESEREVRRDLLTKWAQHEETVKKMGEIIEQYGLNHADMMKELARSIGIDRVEVSGDNYRLINNDAVEEAMAMPDKSVGMVLTSIPFSTQYEYTPSYNDFGHTDSNDHFFEQMDFLIPELLRVLEPGRMAAIHVKDRIVPGGLTGLGFQTVYPFHMRVTEAFTKHGFAYMGMKTIVTDVVRENNQTYRLSWTEQCKDGSKMGVGMPEYLLIFRRPPSESINSYADTPVQKRKPDSMDDDGNIVPFERNLAAAPGTGYSLARWQVDAHAFARSSGERHMTPEELTGLEHHVIFKLFRDFSLNHVYDFEHHVKLGEALAAKKMLPTDFMLLQPHSWHPDVWSDITRMLTLNGAQHAAGREMHLCLARGSRVLTKERGYVPIETVMQGENVLTHKGRWRPVRLVKMTGVQPVITVEAQGVPGLTLTPDHELWTRKSDWVRERDGAERAEPAWVEAQNTIGGYVNLQLPPVVPARDDAEFWWTVGRWLADGHTDGRNQPVISVGPSKWDAFAAKIGRFSGNTPHAGTALQIQLRDPDFSLRRTLEKCGRGAADKRLPAEAFTLPTAEASALLDGYLSGDGHHIAERERWTAMSVSRDLLLGLAVLVQRVYGTIASIHAGRGPRECVIEGRTVQAQQEWVLSFDIGTSRKKPFILADGAWKKVRNAIDEGTAETWCLKVDEDESFTAEGCIVKNCPLQFDIVDRAIEQWTMEGETVYDPFGGLGTVVVRALKLKRKGISTELNTGYFLDSCTYAKAEEQRMSMPSLFDAIEAEESTTQEVQAVA